MKGIHDSYISMVLILFIIKLIYLLFPFGIELHCSLLLHTMNRENLYFMLIVKLVMYHKLKNAKQLK